jgi:hypothetical protein
MPSEGLAAGFERDRSEEEVGLTTLGFPLTMAAMSSVEDILKRRIQRP